MKNSSIKILVVEDDAAVSLDIRISLEDLGYTVVGSAKNYTQALEIFRNNSPNLVLLDINLKNSKSGLEIAEVIQKESNTPFVFLTAFGDRSTFDQAKALKPMAYVNKPFTTTELRNAVEMAMVNVSKTSGSDKEYIMLLDQLQSPAILCNKNLEITSINKSLERLTGYLEGDILHKNVEQIVSFNSHESNKYTATLIHRNSEQINVEITKIDIKENAVMENHIYVIDEKVAKESQPIIISEQPKIEDSIFIKHKGDYHRLLLSDIEYVSALDNYVSVVTHQKKYIVHSFLTEFENKLPNNQFLRVHRSHLVNLLKVDKINELGVVINDASIPVSRGNKKSLMERLQVIGVTK